MCGPEAKSSSGQVSHIWPGSHCKMRNYCICGAWQAALHGCKIYAVSFAATRTQLEIVTLVSERKIISRIKYTQRGADNNAAAIRSAIV